MEAHLQTLVQTSLASTPEDLLQTALDICVDLAGGDSGSILGEEGPYLQFLVSDVKELIGVRVPFDSIAGVTVTRNLVVYTHAPSDKRHFAGVDEQINRRTEYLLSVPIPSIHHSASGGTRAKNAGALQVLFRENIFPDLDVEKRPCEFQLSQFKDTASSQQKFRDIFTVLPMIAFSLEVMKLRQTSYQVIHELKNKMISGLSWVDFLREDIARLAPQAIEDGGIQEDFALAASAMREGSELARNYLQFTKIYTPDFADADVAEVLRETAASVRALGAELKIEEFEVDIILGEPLPVKQLDAGKLKMALFNLCKNAAEALKQHQTPKPRIALSCTVTDAGALDIGVRDNGPGMPPEIADALFIPFKTKKDGGTGLGLTITKKIVDLHGGTICCQTGPQGTEFSIELP